MVSKYHLPLRPQPLKLFNSVEHNAFYFIITLYFAIRQLSYWVILTLKALSTTAADNILECYFALFFFSKKIRPDISCESSARKRIHMKHQA